MFLNPTVQKPAVLIPQKQGLLNHRSAATRKNKRLAPSIQIDTELLKYRYAFYPSITTATFAISTAGCHEHDMRCVYTHHTYGLS
jgi:hypothetical protein